MSDPAPETKEEYDERVRLAERAHDGIQNGIELHFKQVEAFAILTLRSLVIVAIGGIAASLGFYSANYVHLVALPGALAALNQLLVYLFVSLILTLLSSACGYFSQIGFAAVLSAYDRTYTYPFVTPNKKSKRYLVWGQIFRWSSILTATASAGCLIAAGVVFAGLIR